MSTSGYAVASGLKQPGKGPVPTNLPVVDEADATGEIAEAYQYFREHFGRPAVPGILKCFSSSPEMLKIIIQLGSTLVFSEGVLGRRMKEMIATYVSSLNECPYCLDSHAASLCSQRGDEALLNALLTGDLGDVSISGGPSPGGRSQSHRRIEHSGRHRHPEPPGVWLGRKADCRKYSCGRDVRLFQSCCQCFWIAVAGFA